MQRSLAAVRRPTLLLIVTMVPVMLLTKPWAKLIDHGTAVLGAPAALIVFPKGDERPPRLRAVRLTRARVRRTDDAPDATS